ncbi:MAG: AAA family ATPase, partial [Acidimicrobiia bacterium]
ATRSPKQDHPLAELEVEWRHRADQVGLTAERVASVTGRSRQVTTPDPPVLFDSLGSPDGLTAQASTFTKPEVVKEVAGALPEGGTRTEIEDLAEMFLSTHGIVPVLVGRDVETSDTVMDVAVGEPGVPVESPAEVGVVGLMRRRDGKVFPGAVDRLYTTVELLAIEQRIIQHATAGVAAGRWVVPHRLVEARLVRHRFLTDGQREMVRSFATSGNTVDIGIGPAGTGKTAVMAVISQLATLTGTPIMGAALAARAAAGLQAATGIRSTTLTRLLNQPGQESGLPSGVVVVVDEAGMVGTRQLAAVSDLVEQAEGKLILIGDEHQLPEINAGGLFRALTNRLPTTELTDNVRQRHLWERIALTELRDGSVKRAVGMYRQHKRVIIGHDRDDTISRAVGDWYRHVVATGDLTSGLLIGYENNTVAELNQLARSHLAASQHLNGPTLRTAERNFETGDRILCRKNHDRFDVLNGDLGTVVSVDPDHRTLTVRLDRDPETRELPFWYLDEGHVDYGYALTGHKAQGVTTDRTFTVVAGGTDREWAYVAMSRGSEANTLYLATPEPGDELCTHLTHEDRRNALDALTSSLGRSSTQTAAIDHIVGPPPPSSDVAERVAWIVTQRRAERNELERMSSAIELAAER